MHPHPPLKPQPRQQLGRNKKILTRAINPTSNLDHAAVDEAFVAGVHALVDFVDDAEGGAGEGLERHEVEDCAYGALAAGLAVRVEEG